MPGPTVHSSARALTTGNIRIASAAATNVLIIRCSVSSLDPASTNHDIVLVKHHGLPGGDGQLRLVEHQLGPIVAHRANRRRRRPVTMADLCSDASALCWRIENPVYAGC